VRLLIEKVIVSHDDLEVRFRPNGVDVLVLELQLTSTSDQPRRDVVVHREKMATCSM
jgi:hypothetical protein